MGTVYITQTAYEIERINYVTMEFVTKTAAESNRNTDLIFLLVLTPSLRKLRGEKKTLKNEAASLRHRLLCSSSCVLPPLKELDSPAASSWKSHLLLRTHGCLSVCIQTMPRISYCQCPLGASKAQCLCVTFQISIMTNSVPEATKQLPTLVSVVTLETTP